MGELKRKRRSYRRFFQFSMRTLVLVATLLCVVLGGGLVWWRWPFEVERLFVFNDWDYEFQLRRELGPEALGRGVTLHTQGLRPSGTRQCKEVSRVYQNLRGWQVECLRHGPLTIFDSTGAKLREENWSHGKLHGKWTEWDVDGAVIAEGEFRDGLRHGVWAWHEFNDSPNIRPQRFLPLRTLRKRFISYRNGTVLRDIKHTDDDITIEDWNWDQNGVEQKCVRQSHTGQTLEEFTYRGVYTPFEGEDVLQFVRHGPQRKWHPSGQKQEELAYDIGRRAGEAQGWYANGRPWYQGAWKDDLEHGPWTWWNKDGTVGCQAEFQHGRLLRSDGSLMPDFEPPTDVARGQNWRVLRNLSEPMYGEFNLCPLPHVLKFIGDLYGLKIAFDRTGLRKGGIDLGAVLISQKLGSLPERMTLPSDPHSPCYAFSLRSALQIMLQPHDLAFLVRNNQIVITTRAEAERLAKETP
jgi:antitoxin component YwqK of YwqJK toxin-antitoxin module